MQAQHGKISLTSCTNSKVPRHFGGVDFLSCSERACDMTTFTHTSCFAPVSNFGSYMADTATFTFSIGFHFSRGWFMRVVYEYADRYNGDQACYSWMWFDIATGERFYPFCPSEMEDGFLRGTASCLEDVARLVQEAQLESPLSQWIDDSHYGIVEKDHPVVDQEDFYPELIWDNSEAMRYDFSEYDD